eukprot:m.94289 g.94289  ORF g.94289 m.94289 type:complete len:70 (+) comp13022_c0_seq3:817-1026(+)
MHDTDGVGVCRLVGPTGVDGEFGGIVGTVVDYGVGRGADVHSVDVLGVLCLDPWFKVISGNSMSLIKQQ